MEWEEGTKASCCSLVPSPGHALAWEDLCCVLGGTGTPLFHHHVSGCLMKALGRLAYAPLLEEFTSMMEKMSVFLKQKER